MLFHFLNFSQCVVCMYLGIKLSTKLQISKSTLEDILRLNKSLFKNYSERLIWTTKLFSSICDITNCKSPTEVRLVDRWREHLVELCMFQNRNLCWCFYITVFLMKTNCFQKMLYVILISYLILSDKACVCEQISVLCTGETSLSATTKAPPTGWGWIYIYMRPQIVQVCGTMV